MEMYAGLRWSCQQGGTSIFKALCACSPDVFFCNCTWCRVESQWKESQSYRVQKLRTLVAGLCFHIHVPCQVVLSCCHVNGLACAPCHALEENAFSLFPMAHHREMCKLLCQELLSPFHTFHTRASMHLWPPLENTTDSVTEEWFDEVASSKEG